MAGKRNTYNITEERQRQIARLAMLSGLSIDQQIKWSEFLTYLIDNFAEMAYQKIIEDKKIR
ncbi:hypothetical protein DKF69_22420 [Salmonella enterica]|jgi:hypothetical protein|uniref:hypothetical protein n=1 Tax=Enterobacteriaceae TaxID=543 RepID=UPI000BE5CB42|nr:MULTISPECIES: hypothetical protein [Enterobacteriaceae]EAT0039926.1 hypothetical protein [Salmonella enterica]ECA1660365.1 hypothetical protein [Salmonella enterica subsp. enterica serovar Infantis]EHG0088584.1 hypothetical protein [Salmonella enterica subsp. enterica serovar Newport]EBA4851838.1 hypothetical protein [Salmonella enterica]EBJ7489238.1 hypothetical protein [Salmonella enterica]